MNVFAKTDIGKAREKNEDYYYISQPTDELQLYILADGMGGYNGGEIASNLATNALKGYIVNNFNSIKHDTQSIQSLIRDAIEYANMIVYEKAKEQSGLEGMGTTLEACLIIGNKLFVGHVGDSRVYKINQNFLQVLTNDHSYVEKLVNDGTITKEEAYNHPKKNMLLKAIGCTSFVEPDIIVNELAKGDILLMATDGLTNMLSNEEIYSIIKQGTDNPANKLVERANNIGGYDNITAIVIEF